MSKHIFWQVTAPQGLAPSELSTIINYGYHVVNGWEVRRQATAELGALLLVTLTGTPRFLHGETWHQAERGSICLYLPDESQSYLCGDSWEAYWFHFHPAQSLLDTLAHYGVRAGRVWNHALSEPELERFAEMFAYESQPAALAFRRAAILCERTLIQALTDPPETVQRPRRIRLRDVGQYICLNPGHPHSVSSLARLVHLSPSRFAHLFKTEYGRSVGEYVTHIRMEEACRLLRTSALTAAEIGHRLGYANPYYFYAAFRKRIGRTAGQYRRSSPAT